VRRQETSEIYGRMTVPYDDNCTRKEKVLERLEGEQMGIVGETCVGVKEQIDQY
jgi:hypothetical protein